jgi:hypothetical protein
VAPKRSTGPRFFGFSIKDNVPRPGISAFSADRRAFLTIPSIKPEISAFFPLVSHLIREGKSKMPDIPAFFSWFQYLSNKNKQKGLIFQISHEPESIHMSKSDSYIKVSENNNDK